MEVGVMSYTVAGQWLLTNRVAKSSTHIIFQQKIIVFFKQLPRHVTVYIHVCMYVIPYYFNITFGLGLEQYFNHFMRHEYFTFCDLYLTYEIHILL